METQPWLSAVGLEGSEDINLRCRAESIRSGSREPDVFVLDIPIHVVHGNKEPFLGPLPTALPFNMPCSRIECTPTASSATALRLRSSNSGCEAFSLLGDGALAELPVNCSTDDPTVPGIRASFVAGWSKPLSSSVIRYNNNASASVVQPFGFTLLLNGGESLRVPTMFPPAVAPLHADPPWSLHRLRLVNATLSGTTTAPKTLPLPVQDDNEAEDETRSTVIQMPSFNAMRALCVPANGTSSTSSSVASSSQCNMKLTYTMALTFTNTTSTTDPNTKPPLLLTRHCPPDCTGIASGGVVAALEQCQGYATGAACLAASTAHKCAFGAGDQCRPCPNYAICPGGFLAFPIPGYCTAAPSSGRIYQCPAPSDVRCLGWDAAASACHCGPGYDASVPLCGACAPGYRFLDGDCLQCVPPGSSQSFATSSINTVAAIAATFVAIYVGLSLIVSYGFRSSQLPVSRWFGFRIAGEVVVWLLTTLPVFLQLTRVPSPGFPGFLRQLFSYFQTLEADFSSLFPYECTGSSPFSHHFTLSSIALAATAAAAMLSSFHTNSAGCRQSSVCNWLQYGVFLVAVLLYGPMLSKSIDTFRCIDTQRPLAMPTGVVTWENVVVWAFDMRVPCYEGSHLAAIILAIMAFTGVGVGLPMLLSICACIRTSASVKRKINQALHSNKRVEGLPAAHSASRNCWRLPEPIHAKAREERQWSILFMYGQPWLRPFTLWTMLVITVLSSVLEVSHYPTARAAVLSSLLYALSVFFMISKVPADYQWSHWKRLPRSYVYFASGTLVLLQSLVERTRIGTASDNEAVLVLSWVMFVLTVAAPLVLLAKCIALDRCKLVGRRQSRCCLSTRYAGIGANSVL